MGPKKHFGALFLGGSAFGGAADNRILGKRRNKLSEKPLPWSEKQRVELRRHPFDGRTQDFKSSFKHRPFACDGDMHGWLRCGGGGRDGSISTPQAVNHDNIDQWSLVLGLVALQGKCNHILKISDWAFGTYRTATSSVQIRCCWRSHLHRQHSVCMSRCGLPAELVFEDHVLCHATVVSRCTR